MLLSLKNQSITIHTTRGDLPAVRNVSLDIMDNSFLGVVGESGCGKSTLALSLAGLLPDNALITNQSYVLKNVPVDLRSDSDLLRVRSTQLAYIFQDPQASLNPVMKISEQILESIQTAHPEINHEAAVKKAVNLLRDVRIQDPETWMDAYPHQLSGGMKQRVMIVMALARDPVLLIADEPTTSLDVTVQSEILSLLKELNRTGGRSILFITHDLAVARKLCTQIAVMYAGKIVEMADTTDLFANPIHPYTASLLKSIPSMDDLQDSLEPIPGNVPDPMHLPEGCKFHPRCKQVTEQCKMMEPQLKKIGAHDYACWNPLA